MKPAGPNSQHWCIPAGGGCAAMWWLVHVSRVGGQGLHQGLVHLSLTPTGTAQKGLWTVAGRPHNHTAAVRRGAEHPGHTPTRRTLYSSLIFSLWPMMTLGQPHARLPCLRNAHLRSWPACVMVCPSLGGPAVALLRQGRQARARHGLHRDPCETIIRPPVAD
jgi:hypothetical protein